MRTPQKSPTLHLKTSILTGEGYFYGNYRPKPECNHSLFAVVLGQDTAEPLGCGICHLWSIFQTEIPKRLHEYEVLAENGNPEVSPRFWAHIESQMGLVPPKPEEDLRSFRASRARAYRQPSRSQFPVTFALWKMMGYQPRLAKPLIRVLFGMAPEEISQSTYRVHETIGKGVRMALRYMRN